MQNLPYALSFLYYLRIASTSQRTYPYCMDTRIVIFTPCQCLAAFVSVCTIMLSCIAFFSVPMFTIFPLIVLTKIPQLSDLARFLIYCYHVFMPAHKITKILKLIHLFYNPDHVLHVTFRSHNTVYGSIKLQSPQMKSDPHAFKRCIK